MIAKTLQQQALNLKPLDRLHLVEIILASLDRADPEIEKVWIAESEARYESYKRGETKAVSFNTVKRRIRK